MKINNNRVCHAAGIQHKHVWDARGGIEAPRTIFAARGRGADANAQYEDCAKEVVTATTPDIDRPCEVCNGFGGTCRCLEEPQVSHDAATWRTVLAPSQKKKTFRMRTTHSRDEGRNGGLLKVAKGVSLCYVASSVAGNMSLGVLAREHIRTHYCMILERKKKSPRQHHAKHSATHGQPRTDTHMQGWRPFASTEVKRSPRR